MWDMIVVRALCLFFCLHAMEGSPIEDYPNDYYNDASYYSDEYSSSNSSSENYVDLEAPIKETVVKRNPKFVSTAKTIMVNEGDTIKLPCQVDSLGDFVILWKKGSNILAMGERSMDATNPRIQVEHMVNGNRLVISLADYRQDDGEYTCQLSALHTMELVHRVMVRVQPRLVTVPRDGRLVVQAGHPVTLQCEVVEGSPPPEVSWSRRQRPMPGGERKVEAGSITFNRATRKHSGVYVCSADNGWGSPAEASVILDVQHKPEIQQEETFIHTRDGDEVEITCTVHASPPAEVEWYRNGQLLEADKTVIQKRNNRHSLLLQQVGRVDSYGKYQCRAKNSLGEAMALTEVSGKPTPASFKSPSVGEEAERYVLEWVVTSTSPVEGFLVEWRLPGQEGWTSLEAGVQKVGEESYAGQQQITGLQPDTEYEARVGATNVYGTTNSRVFQFYTHGEARMSQQSTSSSSSNMSSNAVAAGLLSLLLVLLQH